MSRAGNLKIKKCNAMTDLELKKNVETELNWEPSVNAAEFGGAVRDGVVALSGKVESCWEKSAAGRPASESPE
jgi:osmotically-inducible protein OsmY